MSWNQTKPDCFFSDDEWSLATKVFAEVAELSRDAVGVSRPAYSAKETEVLQYLKALASAEGLVANYDAGKNMVFSLPEDHNAEQFVLMGSHADSVPMGGNYDGLAGIVAGLLCLIRAKRSGKRFSRPFKVIALRGEESSWFGPCYIGSKCLLGMLTDAERAAEHKDDGATLDAHLAATGVNMEPVRETKALLDSNRLLEFLELHIEQGPILIEKGMPCAVVSGIRGNFRHKQICCYGEAGHSGAVPREYRKDPVLAVADLLMRLDQIWLEILQKGGDLALTSGTITTDPTRHGLSRIPDKVTFCLDIRSLSEDVLSDMRRFLHEEMKQIEGERKVRFEFGEENYTSPALMSKDVMSGMTGAMERLGLEAFMMASGGGHDASVFANAGVPSGMVFVRNQNGSHNPDEDMEIRDLLRGTSVIYEYMMKGRDRVAEAEV